MKRTQNTTFYKLDNQNCFTSTKDLTKTIYHINHKIINSISENRIENEVDLIFTLICNSEK